jgi:sulfur carrier protein
MSTTGTTQHDDERAGSADTDGLATAAIAVAMVNGERHEIPAGFSVERMLERLGLAGSRVAVAINREVVPRSTFAATPVVDGDQIEVLEAVGGG